jgi:hypothetical protein
LTGFESRDKLSVACLALFHILSLFGHVTNDILPPYQEPWPVLWNRVDTRTTAFPCSARPITISVRANHTNAHRLAAHRLAAHRLAAHRLADPKIVWLRWKTWSLDM